MSSTTNLEQRVAVLEQTVTELQQRLATLAVPGNWLEKLTGSISDESAFLEALEYGRAFRQGGQMRNESGETG